MPDDKVRKMADDALNRLMAELEAGKSEALQNYLSTMGRFHRYSWGNVLLISSQRPAATRVAGFHAWHQLGRAVRKGEKGIMIFAPVLVKNRAADLATEEERSMGAARLSGFRTAYVFDVDQTEGKPLPEFSKTTGDPKDSLEKLKGVVAAYGIKVTYDANIAPAQGVSTGGTIRLVPGLSGAEEFSVLAHELAHEMMHHGNETQSPPKVVRETQAEAVAFVVCRAVGLETNTAAADYIALYNGDKKTLVEALSAIQATSAKILEDVLPDQEREPSISTVSESAPQHGQLLAPRNDWEKSAMESPAQDRATPTPSGPAAWDR